MEAHGRIVAIHDGRADVELAQTTACTSCKAKSTCASSQDQGRTQIVTMDAPLYARSGDTVTVTVSGGVLRGPLLAYLLPTVTTLLGTLLFSPGGDVAAAGGMLGGLILGLGLVRLASHLLPNLVTASCEPTATSHPSI